jgi:hypothetical protein
MSAIRREEGGQRWFWHRGSNTLYVSTDAPLSETEWDGDDFCRPSMSHQVTPPRAMAFSNCIDPVKRAARSK